MADPTDPPTPPGQQPWPRTPAEPRVGSPRARRRAPGRRPGPCPTGCRPRAVRPRRWARPGRRGATRCRRRPARPGCCEELGLILLLAFAPSLLGLLFLALGPAATGEIEAEVAPSLIGIVIDLFISWSPVLVIGYLLARSREGWAGIGLTRFKTGDLLMGLVLWVASFVLVLVLAQLFQYFGQREVDFLPEACPCGSGRCRRC